MTESATQVNIPGYIAGTWTIDPVHTDISFIVRHMMVSKVRGHFTSFEGSFVTGETVLDSSVNVTIDTSSISTNNEMRDKHLKSPDFFEFEKFPKMTFVSTGIREKEGKFLIDGDLSMKGVTKSVSLETEINGFQVDAKMGTKSGFSATTTILRSDFGIGGTMPLEGSAVVVSDEIHIILEVEGTLQQ